MILQVRFKRAVIEAAQGYGVDRLAVEREVAHKVDGGLKHPHLIRRGIVRDGKADILIAACHISAKTFAVSVVGPTQACVFCLPRAVLSDEHAVVMLGVLVQQTAVHKLPDHLRGDAAFAQVGKDSAVIRIPGWQGKGLLHLVPLDGWHCFGGGISGPAIEGEQILDSFRKCLVAELLHESDGVAARVLRVAEPCATVLDPQAVHFCCGVVPANAFDLIAQMGQQLQQIRFPDNLHFCVCKASFDFACHGDFLLSLETQKAGHGTRAVRMP